MVLNDNRFGQGMTILSIRNVSESYDSSRALGDPFLNVLTTWPLTWSLAGRLTLSKSSSQSMAGYKPLMYTTQRLAVSNTYDFLTKRSGKHSVLFS